MQLRESVEVRSVYEPFAFIRKCKKRNAIECNIVLDQWVVLKDSVL